MNHEKLDQLATEALSKAGWRFPVIDFQGSWSEHIEVAFHDEHGPIGIIFHAREALGKYCLREPQVKAASRWSAPVYVIFDNGKVINARVFKLHAQRHSGRSPGDLPYYELPLNFLEIKTFKEVFGK